MPVCDYWKVIDNSDNIVVNIAHKEGFDTVIENVELWGTIQKYNYGS